MCAALAWFECVMLLVSFAVFIAVAITAVVVPIVIRPTQIVEPTFRYSGHGCRPRCAIRSTGGVSVESPTLRVAHDASQSKYERAPVNRQSASTHVTEKGNPCAAFVASK